MWFKHRRKPQFFQVAINVMLFVMETDVCAGEITDTCVVGRSLSMPYKITDA